MRYEYETEILAQRDIDNGTALAFYQPFIDKAIAAAPEEIRRPLRPGLDFLLRTDYRTTRNAWRLGEKQVVGLTHQVVLYVRGERLARLLMRKDGSVNMTTLNAAVGERLRLLRAEESIPEKYRSCVKPVGDDLYDVVLPIGRLEVTVRAIPFDRIMPVIQVAERIAVVVEEKA